jgi:hypothetical protein
MIGGKSSELKKSGHPFSDTIVSEDMDETSETGVTNETSKLVDRYGFYINDDFHTSLLVSVEEMKFRKEKEAERTTKWIKMIKNWDGVLLNRKEKLKRRTRKGVPDHVRGFVWIKLSGAATYRKEYPKLEAIDIAKLDLLTVDEVKNSGMSFRIN